MSILNSSVSKKISVKLSLNEINEIKLYIKGAVDGFAILITEKRFLSAACLVAITVTGTVHPCRQYIIIMFLSVKITQRKSRLLMSVCFLNRYFPMMYIGNMS